MNTKRVTRAASRSLPNVVGSAKEKPLEGNDTVSGADNDPIELETDDVDNGPIESETDDINTENNEGTNSTIEHIQLVWLIGFENSSIEQQIRRTNQDWETLTFLFNKRFSTNLGPRAIQRVLRTYHRSIDPKSVKKNPRPVRNWRSSHVSEGAERYLDQEKQVPKKSPIRCQRPRRLLQKHEKFLARIKQVRWKEALESGSLGTETGEKDVGMQE